MVIVGSLLLILVAVALLVAGVLGGSNILIVCSIVATILAAIVLIVGVRQSASAGDADEIDNDADGVAAPVVESASRPRSAGGRRSADREPAHVSVRDAVGGRGRAHVEEPPGREATPGQGTGNRPTTEVIEPELFESGTYGSTGYETASHEPVSTTDALDDDPPDEPSAQVISASSAARVALLTADVLVIDGRPRYHVSRCVHLLGRRSEPIPVGEAVELGFTPCGLCEPDSALLAEARRA